MGIRNRGAVLIAVLILLVLILVMGMAILNVKSTQAKSSLLMRYSKMAKLIAQAGMEDARVKLCKDMDFPPQPTRDEYCFSYSETLQYPGDSAPAGQYVVTIDLYRNDPALPGSYDQTLLVTSEGIVTNPDGSVAARHRISAVFDTAQLERGSINTNPYRYKFIDWRDHGNL